MTADTHIKADDIARYLSEDDIHRNVAAWLDAKLPADWRWFHCPNGGGRSKATAGRLKAMGVKPGVFDIIIMRPNGPDIWIELKAHGNYMTPAQREWSEWLAANKRPSFVCRSLGEVVNALKAFLP